MRRNNCPYSNGYTYNQLVLISEIRMFWEQNVQWTRALITSAAFGTKDFNTIAHRLFQNPKHLGEVFEMFFGGGIAKKYESLMEKHLRITIDLIKIFQNKDASGAAIMKQKWCANADDLAQFLEDINPNWDKKRWQNEWYDHIQMTEDEIKFLLFRDFENSIKIYDLIEKDALKMANYMAAGILKHFQYR